jgi:hypothetical protein
MVLLSLHFGTQMDTDYHYELSIHQNTKYIRVPCIFYKKFHLIKYRNTTYNKYILILLQDYQISSSIVYLLKSKFVTLFKIKKVYLCSTELLQIFYWPFLGACSLSQWPFCLQDLNNEVCSLLIINILFYWV